MQCKDMCTDGKPTKLQADDVKQHTGAERLSRTCLAPPPADLSMGHILTLILINVVPSTAGQLYVKAPDESMA